MSELANQHEPLVLADYSPWVERLRAFSLATDGTKAAREVAAVIVRDSDLLDSLPAEEGFVKVSSTKDRTVADARDILRENRALLEPWMFSLDKPVYHHPLDPGRRRGSSTLYHLGQLARLWDDKLFGVPNTPGPLSSMLVLGTLGAMGGYGTSKGISFLKNKGNPKRDRRMALLGAGAGLIPGLALAALNYSAGGKIFGRSAFDPKFKKDSSDLMSKVAAVFTPDQVRDLVEDPWVANRMPPMVSAATVGIVEGAQQMNGRRQDTPFVTPIDVARMSVGMGSGYLSGALVGRALGGLLGVSDSTQQVLRQSGAAAGLLKSVVPTIFGAG